MYALRRWKGILSSRTAAGIDNTMDYSIMIFAVVHYFVSHLMSRIVTGSYTGPIYCPLGRQRFVNN